MSPAIACSIGRRVAPSGEKICPTRSSASWSGWPRSPPPCPDTCTAVSGVSVPENTRRIDSRPWYGSTDVRTTSASSGPDGSQLSVGVGLPNRPITAGGSSSVGRRETAGEHLQQLGQPEPGRRAHRHERVERAARDGGLEVVDQHVEVDLVAVREALEQRLVLAVGDDRLDERVARVLDVDLRRDRGVLLRRVPGGVVEPGPAEQPDQAGRRLLLTAADRQVERQHVLPVGAAEHLLAGGDGAGEVGARRVQPADHHRARRAERGALLPERDRDRVDLVGRGHDEQCGVGGAQPGAQFTGEVGVAGRVEQVDDDVVPVQRAHRQRDRALLRHLDRVVVADRRAVRDRTGPRDHVGGREQRFDERRLAAAGVADEGDVADLLRSIRRLEGASG